MTTKHMLIYLVPTRNKFCSGNHISMNWTNILNPLHPWYTRAARSNRFLVLFCSVLIFWISFERNGIPKMDFPLEKVWSLSRSQRSPKISCIGNCIKKLWLRSANLYFAQRNFFWRTEFQNGFSFWMDVELIK